MKRIVVSDENSSLKNDSFIKKGNRAMDNSFSFKKYLEWIERFTTKYNGFSCVDWLNFPDELSESDCMKMQQVDILYSKINKYANDNYISPILGDFGKYFNIKIFSKFYEIGIYDCEGGIYYCNRILNNQIDNFIDIEDVINNKKTDYALSCEKTLSDFSSIIDDVYKKGIPINLIVSTFNNKIDNIRDKSAKKYVKKS